MIDCKMLSEASNIQKGAVCYNNITAREDILGLKVDKVVSIKNQEVTILNKINDDGSEVWTRSGIELNNTCDISENLMILPQSQWEG